MSRKGIRILCGALLLIALGVAALFLLPIVAIWIDSKPKYTRAQVHANQRQTVLARVETAGGWEAIRFECEKLWMERPQGFTWHPPRHATVYPDPIGAPALKYETNIDHGPPPPALATLQPRDIRAYPNIREYATNRGEQIPLVRIKIFGAWRSGASPIPYYGLWVAPGPVPDNFVPKLDIRENTMTPEIRRITNGIFEVY